MFGFIVGTICLIGFAKMWRRHRGYRRYGWGHGGGYDGYRGDHGRGWGPVDYVLRRLDATPEQARVIRGEVEDVMSKGRQMRGEWRNWRDDIAKALRAEAVDAEVMGEAFARQDEELTELRKAFVGALSNIHDVLDERQRRRLAELVENGPQFSGYRPYR